MTDAQQDSSISERTRITQPDHYKTGGVQPIDLIDALGDGPPNCRANVIKYVSRYDRKNGVADLYKASEYLDRLIAHVERAERQAGDLDDDLNDGDGSE